MNNTASGISDRTLVLLTNKTQTAVCVVFQLSSYDGQRKRVFTIVVLLVSISDVFWSTTRDPGTK